MLDTFGKQLASVFLELAPWMLVGAAAAGLLHRLVPVAWMKRHLSGRGGVVKAALFGVPLPLCSCGVIPVGMSLKKDGAGNGAVVGFLIATPQTGVDSILVSGGFLGFPFAVFKLVSAFVTGLIGGWLTDLLVREPPPSPATHSNDEAAPRTWKLAWEHGLEMLHSIWKWLVFGVVISAAISTFLPDDGLSRYSVLAGPWSLVLTVVVSIPLYVCATASVPIAATLVACGMPPGAALVFLMAGPATNVATLGAVYRTLGFRTLVVYLSVLIVGSIGCGLLMPGLIDVQSFVQAHQHNHFSWWHTGGAILLAILLLWFAATDVRRWLNHRSAADSASDTPVHTISVSGMTCNGCASRLERTLSSMEEVQSAVVTLENGQAVVQSRLSRPEIAERIRAAGFGTPAG
ncbi:MAG: permease [Planctomycetaceae bacterium]|nr:permease [Planctomycetaceae bacterium]